MTRHQITNLSPGLYIVATPIGNLGDITLRALDTLREADLILCEDTRVTRKLLNHYDIATKLLTYHDHNAARRRDPILDRLKSGERIALVSDAGTPLIGDPGYKLVRACQAADLNVSVIPGANAGISALCVSGISPARFLFAGFLPPKKSARQAEIARLKSVPASLIFHEAPPRLAACLRDLSDGLGRREAAIIRELTKKFEEVKRGELVELANHYENATKPKGEIVLLIGPPEDNLAGIDVAAALEAALGEQSLKDAVSEVAELSGLSRRELYQTALMLKEKGAIRRRED